MWDCYFSLSASIHLIYRTVSVVSFFHSFVLSFFPSLFHSPVVVVAFGLLFSKCKSSALMIIIVELYSLILDIMMIGCDLWLSESVSQSVLDIYCLPGAYSLNASAKYWEPVRIGDHAAKCSRIERQVSKLGQKRE